jgi:hypothetical protein
VALELLIKALLVARLGTSTALTFQPLAVVELEP